MAGSSFTENSGLLESRCKLKGALAAGGVYDQRGLSVSGRVESSCGESRSDSRRLWTAIERYGELKPGGNTDTEHETALKDR